MHVCSSFEITYLILLSLHVEAYMFKESVAQFCVCRDFLSQHILLVSLSHCIKYLRQPRASRRTVSDFIK